MKRVFAFFVAVVLILPLCGCSGGEPLTKQEYYDKAYEHIQSYNKLAMDLIFAYHKYEEFVLPFNLEKLREQVKSAKNSLEELKSLVPPKEYKKHHSKLCKAIKSSKPFLNELEKALEAENSSEFYVALVEVNEAGKNASLLGEFVSFQSSVQYEVDINPDRLSADKAC